jgi:gliding motility-associated-like protein
LYSYSNGDNTNDELFVRGEELIESMELIVYNRWGQEVWRTTSPNSGWNGTFKGEKLRPDVLGFYLKVKCIDGQEFIKKGNVSIIR